MNTESTSPAKPSSSVPDAPRPRRRLRRWLITVGVVVVLLGLLVALAPTLVSTGPGTRLALSIANGYIPGKVDVAELSVGWFSGTSVDGLKIVEPDGRPVLSTLSIAMPDFTLLKAAEGSTEYGTITLTSPEVTYEQYADGTNSIARALVKPGPEEPAKPQKPIPPIRAKLVLSGGTIKFISPAQAPVTVEDLTVHAEIATLASITADAKATVKQGASGGAIHLKKLIATDLFDAAGKFQPDRAAINTEASLTNLPISAVDDLTKADGKLLALLGDKAELDLSASGTLANLTGAVNVATPKLTARMDFVRTEKDVTLSAAINARIDPPAWARLTSGKDGPLLPAITKPVVVDLALHKHTQAFENNRIDLAAILDKVTLQPVELAFDAPGGPATATLAKTGTQVTLTVPPPLAASLLKQYARQDETLAKVGLADAVTVTADIAEMTLATGEKYGLSFKGGVHMPKVAVTGLPQVSAVTASGLSADLAYDSMSGPAARVAADIRLGEVAFPADKRLTTTRLANLKVSLPLASLDGPMKVTLAADIVRGEEKGTLAAEVELTRGPTLTFDAMAKMENLPLELADVLANQNGRLVAIAGSKVARLTISAGRKPADKEAIHFDVDVETDHITAKLAGLYAAGDRVELHDSSLAIGLTPQSFDSLLALARPTPPGTPPSAPAVVLQQDARVNVAIAALTVPLPKATPSGQPATFTLDPERTRADISLTVPSAEFKLTGSGDVVAVKDFSAKVSTENPVKETTAVADARFTSGSTSGAIASKTTITQLVDDKGNIQFAKAGITTDTKLKGVPLRLVDDLAGLGGKLVRSIGPTMHRLDLAAKSAGSNQPIDFTIIAQSDALDADLRGAIEPGKRLSIARGSTATLTVTDDLVAMIQEPGAAKPNAGKAAASPSSAAPAAPAARKLTLQKPAKYQLKIAEAEVAWLAASSGAAAPPSAASTKTPPEPMRIDPAHTRLSVDLTGEPTTLVLASSNEQFTLSNVKVTAETANPAGDTAVTAHFDVEIGKPGQAATKGQFESKTTLTHLVAADGLVQVAKALITTDTSIDNIPTQPLDALAGLNGKLYEVLGPTVKATVVGAWRPGENSPLHVTLDSQNTQGDLRFLIDKDKVLRLEQDGRILVKLTPELAKNLGLVNPMLFQAAQSDNPIECTLRGSTMAVPLSPFNLAAARVDGLLNMGTVTMQNGGLMNVMLLMMSQVGASGQAGSTIKATFTPVTFRLDKGIITTNDLWMSSDLITMGTQVRSIDLNPALKAGETFDASKVPGDILIALSGRDFMRVPYLQQVFKPTYIYELPAKGPINSLKPDFGDFLAQITKMKVQAEAAQQLANLGVGESAVQLLEKMMPQGKNQAEIQKRWPNQPKAPAASAPAAAPEKTPQPASKPALPRLPDLKNLFK